MRRLLSLGVHTLGTSFDVGLLVVGTGLVGLAIAVLLDGFGVVEIGLSDSTGSMLGSGLVIAVFGAFALGVAVEGPIGYSTRRRGTFSDIEVAIAGAVGALLAGLILFLVANYVRRFVEDLPMAFDFGVTIIRSAGRAGMTFGLFLGVPALWGVRELWGAQLMGRRDRTPDLLRNLGDRRRLLHRRSHLGRETSSGLWRS